MLGTRKQALSPTPSLDGLGLNIGDLHTCTKVLDLTLIDRGVSDGDLGPLGLGAKDPSHGLDRTLTRVLGQTLMDLCIGYGVLGLSFD